MLMIAREPIIALIIYLGLATTYIGIPAFAGIPMREIDFYI